MLNADKLRGKIRENRLTLHVFATMLGINEVTLHRKLSGASEFDRAEMMKMIQILRLTQDEIMSIFFATT